MRKKVVMANSNYDDPQSGKDTGIQTKTQNWGCLNVKQQYYSLHYNIWCANSFISNR
jgi:hypothetical protein